jgi:hypothetical protein
VNSQSKARTGAPSQEDKPFDVLTMRMLGRRLGFRREE